MNTQHQKKSKPPGLLRGLFSIIVIISGAILLSAWAIINYQIEQLVAQRTSEYAHSIAKIAANSSAEALLSDNKAQLRILVENVAKDPYIRNATIYSEEGQIVTQFPDPENTTSKLPHEIAQYEATSDEALKAQTKTYVQSKKDIPFVEKINHKEVTAGWFKITLNREQLENSFRHSLTRSQNIILIIAGLLLLVLFVIVLRFEQRIKLLVSFNDRLIQLNTPDIPVGLKQWMAAIKELSETRFQNLPEHKQLPSGDTLWLSCKRSANTIFCYFQFEIETQDNELTASSLTQAESYLQAAIQTHGLQSQGDVLSGCLIPFFDNSDRKEALTEALGLIQLIQDLLESLQVPIKMRAFVGSDNMLVLENERSEITGVSLSRRIADKIYRLSPHFQFGDTIALCFEQEDLRLSGEFKEVNSLVETACFQLLSVNQSIRQQVSRQVKYIRLDSSELIN